VQARAFRTGLAAPRSDSGGETRLARVLFETDTVSAGNTEACFAFYEKYAPPWWQLTPESSLDVRKGNYERLFDEARRRVRVWEKANVP
jgi:hypothetical protein